MRKQRKPPSIRTTISLAKVVDDLAQEMMEIRGFNGNFSNYIADLVRRDKERLDAATAAQSPAVSPPVGTDKSER